LFAFQTEVDADTMEPKSELSSPARDWCKEMGIKGKTVEEVLNGSDNARLAIRIRFTWSMDNLRKLPVPKVRVEIHQSICYISP
jgi:hypothetical protein